ncbi:Uncharacterised protein [Klebsiella oxytoca]|uniref:hypothetical protein n=1 Tax=Klebsiella oxytoca TaxID=571 RepID=UPI001917CF3D|nr:hypothetical protein [Klebsiella oxytoca]CAA0287362.1 Uncharacterised protein [Klebsiella oxytoca]
MSELSILVHTAQRFPLRFTYTPGWDSISASLYLRPSTADRKIGMVTGRQLAFVAGQPAQRLRLSEPDYIGDGWSVWLASTAFDIDESQHARLRAWIAETFAIEPGSASQ